MTSVDRGNVRGSYKKDTTARNALTVTRAQQGEQNHNVYSVLQIVLLNQLIGREFGDMKHELVPYGRQAL